MLLKMFQKLVNNLVMIDNFFVYRLYRYGEPYHKLMRFFKLLYDFMNKQSPSKQIQKGFCSIKLPLLLQYGLDDKITPPT